MNCLLCLKINEKDKKYITTNSTEWTELNIQYIIEKYLWKMEHLNTDCHICQTCWEALNSFHSFYTDVERAHTNLKSLIKTEIVSEDIAVEKQEYNHTVESNQLEPEILLVKEENPLEIFEIFEKEEVEDFGQLKKKIKRRSSRRQILNKCKNTIKKKSQKEKKKNQSETTTNKLESEPIKNENDDIKLEEEKNSSKEEEFHKELDDTRSDSDDEQANTTDSPKVQGKRQANDQFIAEHLKIVCTICQKELETFSITIKHYKEEHNQRGYATCCNRKMYDRSEIIGHIKLHENPEYFKCTYCDKILSSRACLKLHVRNIHEQFMKNIECDICGKSLSSDSSLKMHKLMHDTENNKKIPCKQCDKSYLSKYSLSNHVRTVHLKKYQKICDLCGSSFSEKSTFLRHMLEHEGKPLPMVTCDVCGRRLSGLKSLKRHINSHHPPNGIKNQFNCSICMKVFASSASLRMHIKVVHENSYESKCTLCEKTFKRPDALKDHMAKHVGEPLHACGFCPKAFYSNGQMHAHRKKIHPMEWEELVKEKFSGNLPEKYAQQSVGSL